MDRYVEKLLSISESVCSEKHQKNQFSASIMPHNDLILINEILSKKNGFYAFESALHFYGTGNNRMDIDLIQWNSEDLWINWYKDLRPVGICFAEDLFGNQFVSSGNGVFIFNNETGEQECIANSVAQWCKLILDDYEYLTGYPLAHEWQKKNGALRPKQRLGAKIPFVLEGEFTEANLYAIDCIKLMRANANLAIQISNMPDGGSVKLRIS